MTVQQFIERLQTYDPNMTVGSLAGQHDGSLSFTAPGLRVVDSEYLDNIVWTFNGNKDAKYLLVGW